MSPKGSYYSVMVRFGWRSRLGIAPNDRGSIARRKDGRTDVDCLSCHDSLIVNSVFESRASQPLDGFIKVPCIVKYPNSGRHGSHTYGLMESAIGRQTLQEDFAGTLVLVFGQIRAASLRRKFSERASQIEGSA